MFHVKLTNGGMTVTIKVKASNVASIVTFVVDALAIVATFFPSVGHVVQEASILAGGLVTTGWVHATKSTSTAKSESQPPLIHG
jgi:hypothetical protein